MTKSKIKVSIVVPCYNVEKFLPKCLDSLINQTLTDIEIIGVNDGSPDNCLQILKQYKQKFGEKIIIIDKKNAGVWQARMDGIKKARGEFIGFIDSDDYIHKDFAKKLYENAINNKSDIVVCGFERINTTTQQTYSKEMCNPKTKNLILPDNVGQLLEINTAPWNKLYRATILKKLPRLNCTPVIGEDMVFLQLIYLNTKKITFIKDVLNYYLVHDNSAINTVTMAKVQPTYDAMVEVRKLYEKKNRRDYLEYTDANAFLHLGISLMYRLSEDKTLDFNKVLKENIEFLDKEFPYWKNNQYIKLPYIFNNKGANLKIWGVRQFYRLHLFKAFLASYKFMINKLGVDIKW